MGLSLDAANGGYSLVAVYRPLIVAASVVAEHRLWGLWASVAVARGFSATGTNHVGTNHALDHRINRCGMQALLFHSMWDLPCPGMEPISPIGRLILYPESPRKLHFLVFDDQPWNCPDPGGCGI